MLAFLSANGVIYTRQVDDNLFSAHVPIGEANNPNGINTGQPSIKIYQRDQAAGVLGCTTQAQLCNPITRNCTALTGFGDAANETVGLFSNEDQNTAWLLFGDMFIHFSYSIQQLLASLGISALRARNSLIAGSQAPLPSNQWELEVQGWHASSMAMIQRVLLEMATGPSQPHLEKFWSPPFNEASKKICRNMVSGPQHLFAYASPFSDSL